MRDFQVLFDEAEPSPIPHPAYAPYGNLGFPPPPAERPWIFSNFVQSLDGIASFGGEHPTGGDIAQSQEDKWLMGLLRAHADAIIMGLNTLLEETRGMPHLNAGRGPVYRVEQPGLCDLRKALGRGREKVIFVTASARLEPSSYAVFDGSAVDAYVLTTASGAAKLAGKGVKVITAGAGDTVDLALAGKIFRHEYGIDYLLCEGGPTLYGHMSRAGLVDEKFLTISPVEIGLMIPPEQQPAAWEKISPPQERPTTFTAPGFTKENAPWWRWISSRRVGDHQFDRYRRRR
jgi:riboflavin biosynthesis pyrimidine reductase